MTIYFKKLISPYLCFFRTHEIQNQIRIQLLTVLHHLYFKKLSQKQVYSKIPKNKIQVNEIFQKTHN